MNLKNRFKHKLKSSAFVVGLAAFLVLPTAHADVATDISKVRAQASKMFQGVKGAEIIESPAKNVYRIAFDTGGFAFAYVDGDHVLLGDLYNVEEEVNLSKKATNDAMAIAINEIPESKMIVYGPEKPKRFLTVFTDIDCHFCRKLHGEVPALNAAGIQVRYLAFPRAGVGSESYKKYVSVWCNDDQQASLTNAKSGKSVATASCDNPIAETYKIGQEIGVRGTPMIMFDDGTVNPGYAPSDKIIELLGLNAS